ncbi:MAG: YfcE family phosphodiesterase [Tepidisphaeraceae bacterium]|jgi:putative phosphoesterase
MESSGSSGGISADVTVLGILSDTHDRAAAAAAGIATLRAAGAQFLIHCGDVGGESVLDLLAGIPSVFVWGNCDFDRAGLAQYAGELGIQCAGDFADLQLAGKQIAVTHGDNARLLRQLMERDPPYDYLFHGHTHVAADERLGRLRIVNPGALHRTARKTVALVDLNADTVRHLTVGA